MGGHAPVQGLPPAHGDIPTSEDIGGFFALRLGIRLAAAGIDALLPFGRTGSWFAPINRDRAGGEPKTKDRSSHGFLHVADVPERQ